MRKARFQDELVRCGRDPIYFIDNYVKIRHPVKGLIPFKLFDYQRQLLRDFLESRHNVINKGRQLGISELTAAFIVWLILFHPNQSVLVMATKADTAKNMVRKVRTAIKHLPRFIGTFSEMVEDNKLSIAMANGSWIKATTKSADAGRSEALSLLVVDEAAHIPGFDEIWTGIKPTVTAGGRVTMISTPNGVGNVFHRMFVEAEAGRSGWKATTLYWWVHPEHIWDLRDDPERPGMKTSSWYEEETKGMSEREKAQEYECSFLASGATFITGEHLAQIAKSLSTPIDIQELDKGLHIFQRPVEGKRYLVAADVARGDGNDKSSAHVFDIETMDQVAEYDGRLPPDKYADLVCRLGWKYGKGLIVMENNSVGFACLEHVKSWEAPDGSTGYPNVYFTNKQPDSKGEALHAGYGASNPKLVIGFTTSVKTRELMLNKLEELIRNRKINIKSKRALLELQTFVWNGGKPEARSGANDDLVMALALASWIRDTFIEVGYHTVQLQEKILQNYSLEKKDNTAIHGASKDPTVIPRHAMGTFARVSPADMYRMRVRPAAGRETEIDLRQLLDRPKIYRG